MLRILFAGTPELASDILQTLLATKSNQVIACFTQPDKPAGRGRKLTASPVKQQALAHHIPVYQPESLKTPEIQDLITTLAPDVIVVVAYGLIIPKQILTMPKYGCINVHMSLLPKWRGAAPIQHAILAGDTHTGVTIMQMDPGLDTGDILAMQSFPISTTDTSETLQTKMITIGVLELQTVLTALLTGKIMATPQDHTKACYAHKITKQDAQINWLDTANNIAAKIRAFNPTPIAYTSINDTIIRIWQATVSNTATNAAPGTIINSSKHGIEIATTDGIIILQKIQLPGKNPLAIADILNAKHNLFTIGIKLT